MKSRPFRALRLAFAAMLCSAGAYAQSVTIGFGAMSLFDSGGSSLSNGTLFILVADTSGNGFGSVNAGSLTIGNFLNSDDQILGHGFIEDDIGTGSANAIPLQSGGFTQLTTGDALAVLWFPGLTTSSFSLLSGASYGFYTTASPASGDAWTVPAASGNVNIEVLTLSSGSSGRALLTAIPEPSTYAAFAGLGVLLLAAYRRSRQTSAA